MIQCFDQNKKSKWECNTHDEELFECMCCDFHTDESCKTRYFQHAFYTDSGVKGSVDQSYYDAFQDRIGTNVTNTQLKTAEHLFNACNQKAIKPLWCVVHRQNRNRTLCGCGSKSSQKNKLMHHFFNSSDIWNPHPCEITEEHRQLLAYQDSNRLLNGIWIFIFIVAVLAILLIVIWKILKKVQPASQVPNNEDDIELMLQ